MSEVQPRLLVVDDHRSAIHLLAKILEPLGRVQFATNGVDALAQVQRAPPDLVLLDAEMPAMDGFAVCSAIHNLPGCAELPIIFVTARADPESEARALDLGAVDFIHKPISPAVVQARVRTHLALKRRTDEVRQANAELESRVGTRTAELRLALERAEAGERAKSAFLATMSHEIRTPLNAVVGLSGLLADSPLNRRQREYADQIQLSAQALRVLIDDILDFSKIEAGALQLEQAPLSLSAILRTTAAILSASVRGKAVEILFDVAPDIPDALLGDALRLQQILLNLTGNAAKFTEAGEIVVSVRRLGEEGGRVTLQFAVRDTGIGIRQEELGRIFEVFTQAEYSTSRLYGGSGLGLAISSRLADLLGGRIEVESQLGQGSEFRFAVSLALGEAPAPAAGRLPGLRLLVIDDHPLARDLLHRTAAAYDWAVTAVDGGPAGLDELRRSAAEGRHYDLVLVDWRMPGMDGLEMLRQAQTMPDIALPLVVLMASTFELDLAAAASDDIYFDGILAKPLTPSSLLEAVQRVYAGEWIELTTPGLRPARLHGLRLLVAEDNEINQQVVEQILTRAGAEVVIAANGMAAVEVLRQAGAHFDAVLMDLQMPVMDGYTATRVIREELGRSDLPIIALTAFARAEDRDKVRDAGMNGHLSKPIDVDDLLDVLVSRPRGAPGRPGSRSATASGTPLPTLDVAGGLDAFGGDRKRYGDLLRQFFGSHASDAEAARRRFSAGDRQGAARLVHDLRGMANILQAMELGRLAALAEEALLDDRTTGLPELLAELMAAMRALGEAIRQFEDAGADS